MSRKYHYSKQLRRKLYNKNSFSNMKIKPVRKPIDWIQILGLTCVALFGISGFIYWFLCC